MARRPTRPAMGDVTRGKFQVQLADLGLGHGGPDAGHGLIDRRPVLVELLQSDRPRYFFRQRPVTVVDRLRELKRRLFQVHLRLRLVERRLVRTRVDLEQHVPLLDLGPVLEGHLDEVASDARPDGDRRDRLRPAAEILVIGHHPLHGSADGNGERLVRPAE